MNNLVKYTPYKNCSYQPSINSLTNWLLEDSFFTPAFPRAEFFNNWDYDNAANLTQDDKSYSLELALPGYKKEEVKITISNNQLSVAAQINDKKRNFSYSTNFIEVVDENKIEAKLENGILLIFLPKIEKEKQKGKVIKVN